jgi:hypothetical protein
VHCLRLGPLALLSFGYLLFHFPALGIEAQARGSAQQRVTAPHAVELGLGGPESRERSGSMGETSLHRVAKEMQRNDNRRPYASAGTASGRLPGFTAGMPLAHSGQVSG